MIEQINLFPIPVWRLNLTEPLEKAGITFDILQESAYQLKEQQENKIILKSGRHSYQSGDLQRDKTPLPLQKALHLVDHVANTIYRQQWKGRLGILNTWININGPGSYNIRHTHPMSKFSGVFWIKSVEDHPKLVFDEYDYAAFNRGSVGFARDENANNEIINSRYFLKPNMGDMMMFPSHLPHYVDENKTDVDRISCSFNLGWISLKDEEEE